MPGGRKAETADLHEMVLESGGGARDICVEGGSGILTQPYSLWRRFQGKPPPYLKNAIMLAAGERAWKISPHRLHRSFWR